MSPIKKFIISVPTDDRGFLGHACGAPDCRQYFKVHGATRATAVHCPYCGTAFDRSELMTTDQTAYVQSAAREELRVFAHTEIQKVFGNIKVPGVKFKRGAAPRKRFVQPHQEREVDTELECAECRTRFQVYGIFGYCPLCCLDNLQIYDANWAIIKRGLASAPDRQRQLRHAYCDLVAVFEAFCKRKAARLTTSRCNFQVIADARKFFRKLADVDMLAGLSPDQRSCLRRVFQKRHAYTHHEGRITDEYVTKIPEDSALLGTTAALTVDELEDAATALRIALIALVKAVELPG